MTLADHSTDPLPRACRVCGCTDELACIHADGVPCYWADDDICSVCADDGTCDLPNHQDDIDVQRFAQAMKTKMALKRDEGRGGWQQCAPDELWRMLQDHVQKGDPVDIANFAMMIWHVQKRTPPTG